MDNLLAWDCRGTVIRGDPILKSQGVGSTNAVGQPLGLPLFIVENHLLKFQMVRKALCRSLFIPFCEDLIGDARRPAIHGGVISTLGDVCAGVAVWTRCKLDDRIATIDLRVDYLRPATAHDLYAEATERLLGNWVGNAQVVL